MSIDTTKIDRFALKGEIRARQAACHAINVEFQKTKMKLAKLHKKLVTTYKADHEGNRKGSKDFLDQHNTYQSIKQEVASLHFHKGEQKVTRELHLAHCYLKGRTYRECEQAPNTSVYSKDIAKCIPGSFVGMELCIKKWLQQGDLRRREIEIFGVGSEKLNAAKEALARQEKVLDKYKADADRARARWKQAVTESEVKLHQAMADLDKCKQAFTDARTALEAKQAAAGVRAAA